MSNNVTGMNNSNQPMEAIIANHKAPNSGAEFFFTVGKSDFSVDRPEVKVAEILAIAGFDHHKYVLVRIGKDDDHEHDHLSSDAVINFLEYGIEKFEVEKKKVEVFINGAGMMILPGDYLVSELKKKLHVPAAHILASLIHQQLKPLDDSSSVCVNGGEKFISYPCDGQAS